MRGSNSEASLSFLSFFSIVNFFVVFIFVVFFVFFSVVLSFFTFFLAFFRFFSIFFVGTLRPRLNKGLNVEVNYFYLINLMLIQLVLARARALHTGDPPSPICPTICRFLSDLIWTFRQFVDIILND